MASINAISHQGDAKGMTPLYCGGQHLCVLFPEAYAVIHEESIDFFMKLVGEGFVSAEAAHLRYKTLE